MMTKLVVSMVKKFRYLPAALLFFTVSFEAQTDSSYIKRCIPSPDFYEAQPVYRTVETMPEYKKGAMEFLKYISNNIKYEGTDYLDKSIFFTTFIVDTSGYIQRICVITKADVISPLEQQLQKLIENSGSWKPGILDHKKVCVRVIIPIRLCFK